MFRVLGAVKQAVFMCLRQITVMSLLLCALITAGSADRAFAAGEGVLGWTGPNNKYYPGPQDACHAHFVNEGGPSSGSKEWPGTYINPEHFGCKWDTYGYCLSLTPIQEGCLGVFPPVVTFECKDGYVSRGGRICSPIIPPVEPKPTPCNETGNPIIIPTGSKIEEATDFSTSDGRLTVDRFYRSSPQAMRYSNTIGDLVYKSTPYSRVQGWAFSFGLEWQINNYIGSGVLGAGTLYLPDGTSYNYTDNGKDIFPYEWMPTSDYKVEFLGQIQNVNLDVSQNWRVTERQTGRVWSLKTFPINPNDSLLDYSLARPVRITDADGYVQNLTYGPLGELQSVTDSYGRKLTYSWIYKHDHGNGGVDLSVPYAVAQIGLPDGNSLVYTYDPPGTPFTALPERLIKVERKNAANVVVETTKYHYEDPDFPSLLTGVTDSRNVRYATFAYDRQGRAVSSQHVGGVIRTTIAYGTSGDDLTRTVTNELGKSTVYTYGYQPGTYNLVLKSVDGKASANCPLSNSTFTYDTNGFVATQTDEEGRVTAFTNDAQGRPLSVVRGSGTPLAVTSTYTWNANWNTPSKIVQPGLTMDYTRNPAGQLTQVTATDTTTQTVPYVTKGQTRSVAYTYSATGQLLTVDGPLAGTSDKVTYAYDANGYVKTVTNELAQVTTINTVNGRGQPTRVTDANGVITDFVWNDLGWLTSVTVAPGAGEAKSVFAYNATGDVTSITRPGGAALTFTYDDARRLTKIANGSNESINYTRDLMDNITQTKVMSGTTIVAQRNQVFDELGRLIRTIGADSAQTWAFGYDKTSNNTTVTDPRSKVWSSSFDALNRLATQTEPGANTVTLSRNGQDDVTAYKDPRNLTTSYVRNGFGDVIRETSPDTGTTDYTYDARGLVTQIKDARNIVMNMTYDAAGRILTRSFPAATAENVSFAYDDATAGNKGKGRLTQITDQAGTSKFVYDVRGNLLSETRTIGTTAYTVSYSYDTADRLLTMTYPSGRIITYGRNADGKVISVTSKATDTATPVTLASNIKWQPMGGTDVFGQGNLGTATQISALPGDAALGQVDLLQSLTYGNGLILWKNFSLDNELYQLIVENGTTKIMNRAYGRLDKTNIDRVWDNLNHANDETLTYTDAARLSTATSTGIYGTRTYTYDKDANRLTETANGVVNTYTYPANSSRLSSVRQGTTTTRAFAYDAAGNTVTDTRGTSAYNYAINSAGRIRTMSVGAALKSTYTYDAFQRLRVKALTSPVSTTHYIWDSFGHIIAEHNGTGGAVQKDYV